MSVSVESFEKATSAPSKHHRRASSRPLLILHILCLLFSLTSVLLFSAAIPQWNANLFHTDSPITSDWSDTLPLIPLSLTILFNVYTLISRFLIPKLQRSSKSDSLAPPPHQPSNKTCFLLTTSVILTLAPLLIVAGLTGVFRFWRAGIPSQSGRLSNGHAVILCNLLNLFARECLPVLYRIGELQIGGIATGSLSWWSVFGLWILYCRGWQQDRRRERRRRARALRKAGGSGSDVTEKTSSSSSRSGGGRSHGQRPKHHHSRHHNAWVRPATKPEKKTVVRSQRKTPSEAQAHLVQSLSNTSRSKYYIPTLPFSRSKPGDGYHKSHHDYWHHDVQQQSRPHGRSHESQGGAVQEVRQKLKPRETINAWLAHRYA